MLQAISGPDETDPFTTDQPPVPNYLSVLSPNFLVGKRVGVMREHYTERSAWSTDDSEEAYEARLEKFEYVLKVMGDLGAEVVDPVEITTAEELFQNKEKTKIVLRTEFKVRSP